MAEVAKVFSGYFFHGEKLWIKNDKKWVWLYLGGLIWSPWLQALPLQPGKQCVIALLVCMKLLGMYSVKVFYALNFLYCIILPRYVGTQYR
jgi:hypothetical protein